MNKEDKRKEAIMWVKALIGEIEGTNLRCAFWPDIIPKKYQGTYDIMPTVEQILLEDGAVWMLKKLFDISEEEIYGEGDPNE